MRFDLLDEYSTLVPFVLGVSERNRVVQYPTTRAKVVKRGTIANCATRLNRLLKFVAVLGRIGRRGYRPMHGSHAVSLGESSH
jgi:hypothetical protein